MNAPLSRTFWWLWTGALLSALATFVFPFLALYLASLGMPAQRIGLIVALLGAGAVLAGPLAGGIADRFGRRPVLIGSLSGAALAAAYLGCVKEPLYLAPGAFLFGLCAMMTFPAINAIVSDLVPAAEVQRAYGLLYWAQNAGIAVSSLAGALFAEKHWTLLFWIDAGTTLLFALLVFRRVPESRPEPKPHEEQRGWMYLLRDRRLTGLLLAHLLFVMVWWQFQFAIPIAIQRQGLGAGTFGAILGTNCTLLFTLQPWISKKLAHRDKGQLLAAGSLLAGLGYGAHALCHTTLQYVLAALVWTMGEMLVLPTASAVIAEFAPEDLRGRYQGSLAFAFSVGMTLSPLVSGFVIEHFGLTVLWSGSLVLGVATAVLHLRLAQSRARLPAPVLRQGESFS
jgi:MFS family permease